MLPTNSLIHFTRRTERKGVFSWPVTVFQLSREGGAEIGELRIHHKRAEYTDAAQRECFSVKSNFWGNSWAYGGDNTRPFARTSIGFRHTITFADGSRYRMKVKRRWRLFSKKAVDEYSHLAIFSKDETEVMRLENFREMAFFGNDITAPMKGTISTELTDIPVIAGFLLLFQTYLSASQHAAMSAG